MLIGAIGRTGAVRTTPREIAGLGAVGEAGELAAGTAGLVGDADTTRPRTGALSGTLTTSTFTLGVVGLLGAVVLSGDVLVLEGSVAGVRTSDAVLPAVGATMFGGLAIVGETLEPLGN